MLNYYFIWSSLSIAKYVWIFDFYLSMFGKYFVYKLLKKKNTFYFLTSNVFVLYIKFTSKENHKSILNIRKSFCFFQSCQLSLLSSFLITQKTNFLIFMIKIYKWLKKVLFISIFKTFFFRTITFICLFKNRFNTQL